MSNVNNEGFDSKMLFIQLTDLQEMIRFIDNIIVDPDTCSVMISDISVKRRSGLSLKKIASLIEIELPSLKKESHVISSAFEDDDDDEVMIIKDHHDLQQLEEMPKQSSLPSLPNRSLRLSKLSDKMKAEEKSDDLSQRAEMDYPLSPSLNK